MRQQFSSQQIGVIDENKYSSYLGGNITETSTEPQSKIEPFTKKTASIQETNLERVNETLNEPKAIKETYGDILPTKKAFEGVIAETWSVGFTGALTNNVINKAQSLSIKEGEGLTEEEFKNSKYYLEGMKYPDYPISESMVKRWNSQITDRKNAEAISLLTNKPQYLARMGAMFVSGLFTDPVMTIAGGFTGGAVNSIAKATFLAGVENLIADELADSLNKELFYLQGTEKTDEERNQERLNAFLFGAGIGGLGYGMAKLIKGKNPKEQLQEEVSIVATAKENYTQENIFEEPKATLTPPTRLKTKQERDLELFKAKEEIKAEIKYKYQEKLLTFKQEKTQEQRFDKMKNLFKAKDTLDSTTRVDVESVKRIEEDFKGYRTTSQVSLETKLPEVLEVVGLSVPEINVKYKVVDLKTLIYSNRPDGTINESFPKKYQPRDREKDYVGLVNIQRMSANLSPNRLIYNAGGLSSGAPLITPDGVVIAGNGRSMALELAFNRGTADIYSSTLKQNFSQFDYNGLERPVLVREIVSNLSDDDLIKLSRKSNVSEVDNYTALENIKNDAKILAESDIALLYNGGDFNSKENVDFYNAFFSRVPEENLKNYLDANGKLTMEGEQKLKSAIVYSAYNDDLIVSNIFVNLEDDVSKSLVNTLSDVASKIIKVKSLIRQQEVDAELDIAVNFAEAFNTYYALDGAFLRDNLNNPNLFGEPFLNPITETIVRGFYRNELELDKVLTKAELQAFFNNYWDKVLNSKSAPLLNEKLYNPKTLLEEAKGNKDIYFVAGREVQYEVVKEQTETTIKDNFIYQPESYNQLQAREIERAGTKEGYKTQGGATKGRINREEAQKILETGVGFTAEEKKNFYRAEGDILNLALFNKVAKTFRDDYPSVAKNGKNMRDFATLNELTVLNELQDMNTKFINENLDEASRFEKLYNHSRDRLEELNTSNPLGKLGIDPLSIEKEMKAVEINIKDEDFKKEAIAEINKKIKQTNELNKYIECRLKK